jgi:hypothetical protein
LENQFKSHELCDENGGWNSTPVRRCRQQPPWKKTTMSPTKMSKLPETKKGLRNWWHPKPMLQAPSKKTFGTHKSSD